MRLLLTAGGVTNPSIRAALVDLLGKPIEESTALCIPTAMYGHPWVGPGVKTWEFVAGAETGNPMVLLGWKSVGLLELTALPSIPDERWIADLCALLLQRSRVPRSRWQLALDAGSHAGLPECRE